MLQGFGFVTWALPIVVLENSDIQTYEDLEGKHVGFPAGRFQLHRRGQPRL